MLIYVNDMATIEVLVSAAACEADAGIIT